MIYFCADDYGISEKSNRRMEDCFKNGVINKISVLPNGEIKELKPHLSESGVKLSLHINLVEGKPLSNPKDIALLISEDGYFKHSFPGLLFQSLSKNRKEFEKQLYIEIQNQIKFWKNEMGEKTPVSIDGHQHTHMIPLIFKTLMRVIRDEGISVESIRIPAEPLAPYVFTPSLYFEYSLKGIIKQWLLKFFALINRKELEKSRIPFPYFMGVMFSGRLNEVRIKKLLPHYIKLAKKTGRNIEIGSHPGYMENGETPICGSQKSFAKFYFSPLRKMEYEALINFKCE